MMRRDKLIVQILLLLLLMQTLNAGVLDGVDRRGDTRYAVRFAEKNQQGGELLIGTVVDIVSDEKEGKGIKLKTAIGTATIYESQIVEITALDDLYRHAHRVFLLPTAEPIKGNHFIV